MIDERKIPEMNQNSHELVEKEHLLPLQLSSYIKLYHLERDKCVGLNLFYELVDLARC